MVDLKSLIIFILGLFGGVEYLPSNHLTMV